MEQSPLVTIPATHQHVFTAAAIGQNYFVSVALPRHYEDHPDRTYPVVYVLDGNWYFGLVVDMVRVMNIRVGFCNELPDAIVVGIGYPDGTTLEEQLSQVCQRRMRDFTPQRDESTERWHRETFPIAERIQSGGADAFLGFLKTELMPAVERNYRIDPTNRCLLGHSLGGVFALHAVFRHPELFGKYVVVSPASHYEHEPWFSGGGANLPVRMYLAVDDAELRLNEEDAARFRRLADLLRRRLTGGSALVEQVFPNNTHCGVVAPAYQAGLVSVLP